MSISGLLLIAAAQVSRPLPDLKLDMPAVEHYTVCTTDYVRTKLRKAETPEALVDAAYRQCRSMLQPAIDAMTGWVLRQIGEKGPTSPETQTEVRTDSERYFAVDFRQRLIRNASAARDW